MFSNITDEDDIEDFYYDADGVPKMKFVTSGSEVTSDSGTSSDSADENDLTRVPTTKKTTPVE
jgi:hypothetical protein